jgi:hypothetical protein
MTRSSASLTILVSLTVGGPLQASGDSEPDLANRYESPQVVVNRILESDRSDKLACLNRFVKLGDLESDLGHRLGLPFSFHQSEKANSYYYLLPELQVKCSRGQVVKIGYWREGNYVSVTK